MWLFDLRLADAGETPFCDADPKGQRLAIHYPNTNGTIGITCTSGAVGKCFRFGYRPWLPEYADLHAACIHMVRGDYGGNDHPWTRNGMMIDVYDDHAIQAPDTDNPMPFEAGWTPRAALRLD